MTLIQLFKLLNIFLLLNIVLATDIKPDNSKNLVKIKVDGKNRTYYHLKKGETLEYNLSSKNLDNPNSKYSLKIISRAMIASNSNSNKVFGVEVSVFDHILDENKNIVKYDLVDSRTLMYDKAVSDAINEAKPGWNYTKAGFWFEELDGLNKTVKISLIDGSPSVELKLIAEEIILRKSESELKPITINEEYLVAYKESSEEEYKKSDNWFLLNSENPLQYKIKGPKIIRFISRVNLNESNLSEQYNFALREDGRFVSKYTYDVVQSGANAFIDNSDIVVSGYKSSFYNVPKGIHYYTFFNNNDGSIYLKIEEYDNK